MKDIHDKEFEYRVDLINKTVLRRTLVNGNYDDKSVAERNYIFQNNLYDNNVKLLGTTSFQGKDCRVFEIRIGGEKIEAYEWYGIFRKMKRYLCIDEDCTQPVLLLEETAKILQVNVPINSSVFLFPGDYQLTFK
jgi:hypothetical protein